MRFPIGASNPQGSLLGLIDTCAGLNIGKLSYHAGIAQTRPELVAEFKYSQDIPEMKDFQVAGINGGEDSKCSIEAVISYKTPYIIKGKAVIVTFALGEHVSTNTVFSYPFLHGTKCSVLFESDTVVSGVLGESFRVESMRPLCADNPPTVPPDAPPHYFARFPTAAIARDIRQIGNHAKSVFDKAKPKEKPKQQLDTSQS